MNFELLGFDIVVGFVCMVVGYIAGRMDLTVNLVKGTTTTTAVHPIVPGTTSVATTTVTAPAA